MERERKTHARTHARTHRQGHARVQQGPPSTSGVSSSGSGQNAPTKQRVYYLICVHACQLLNVMISTHPSSASAGELIQSGWRSGLTQLSGLLGSMLQKCHPLFQRFFISLSGACVDKWSFCIVRKWRKKGASAPGGDVLPEDLTPWRERFSAEKPALCMITASRCQHTAMATAGSSR
jgi:hypothetical protein